VKLVVAKRSLGGHRYEAIVMDDKNRVVFESGLGWNREGKAACEKWLSAYALGLVAA
jgi:hypothetical protein